MEAMTDFIFLGSKITADDDCRDRKSTRLNSSHTLASRSITSWQIGGETMEIVTGFIFLGPQITADGDCSHEIKRCLLLGWKAMTNLCPRGFLPSINDSDAGRDWGKRG